MTGLRPSPLPHHRTCGFPHPAVGTRFSPLRVLLPVDTPHFRTLNVRLAIYGFGFDPYPPGVSNNHQSGSCRSCRFFLFQMTARPHPASLLVRVPTVVHLLRASFRLTSRFPPCVSLRLSLLLPVSSFQITSFSPCRAHKVRIHSHCTP